MVVFFRIIVIHHHSEGPSMMNTMHKSLTIAFLALSIFISGLTVDFVGAKDTAADPTASRRPVDPPLSPYPKFRRLTSEDGLSSDQTWDLAQDKRGFMWFCTADGLNRYDGSRIKVYRHALNDPHSLSNNLVSSVFEDSTGVLWVGTWDGLNRFDPKTDQFVHYPHDPDDPTRLSYNEVTSICEDRSGTAIQSSVKMNKYGLTGVKNNDD